MANPRKEKNVRIKLKQPDRSGPDPSYQTLLNLAEKRGLLVDEKGKKYEGLETEDEGPLIGRLGESIVWSISLTMLHFTLDVLVSHQYAVEIIWRDIVTRAAQAFPSKPSHFFNKYTFNQGSYSSSLLLIPSSCRPFETSASTFSATPAYPPSDILLPRIRCGGKLPYIHYEQTWILRCHETISSVGMSLDMVRGRAGCILGSWESDMLRDLP